MLVKGASANFRIAMGILRHKHVSMLRPVLWEFNQISEKTSCRKILQSPEDVRFVFKIVLTHKF